MPIKGFYWKEEMPTKDEIHDLPEDGEKVWILEVDLDYPVELHDKHISYLLTLEKKNQSRNSGCLHFRWS